MSMRTAQASDFIPCQIFTSKISIGVFIAGKRYSMSKATRDALRNSYLEKLTNFLHSSDEEVLITGTNEFAWLKISP